jgi:hypothetical protein
MGEWGLLEAWLRVWKKEKNQKVRRVAFRLTLWEKKK